MFILFFDDRYFKWVPLLIESITINEPKERICAYGIGLARSQIRELCSYPCVDYIPSVIRETGAILSKLPKRDEKAVRIVQRTASFFLESFYRFPKEKLYMLLDVDSLVANPLTKVKRKMADYDIGMSFGNRRAKAGFIVVNPTEASIGFIKDWNFLLMEGPCHWHKNQDTLFQLYQEYKNEMKFLKFSVSYRDPSSKNRSHIWAAYKTEHGSKEERHILYEKKLKKMRFSQWLKKVSDRT